LSIREVNVQLRSQKLVSAVLLFAVLTLAAMSVNAEAKEEKILILTTTDTRCELIPCG
jgi:hypothetical protein